MNLEKLLVGDEKFKIIEPSEAQKWILERREIIRKIVNSKNENINKKNQKKSSKKHIDNSIAYKQFLEKEWFFIDWNKINNIKNKIRKPIDNKRFLDITWGIYLYSKELLGELNSWLSNIKKVDQFIEKMNTLENKLMSCKSCSKLNTNLKERYSQLIWYLVKFIKILNESKWDIVDYYSNKTDIINLLKTIVNSSKNILNTINKKH